jgi:hypothetical protein
VAEAPRMDAKKRCGVGKSDALDARQIAAAALSLPLEKLRRARVNDGVRQALGILITARDAMSTERTPSVNALTALLRTHVLGLDARRPHTHHSTSVWRGSIDVPPDLQAIPWNPRRDPAFSDPEDTPPLRSENSRLAPHRLHCAGEVGTTDDRAECGTERAPKHAGVANSKSPHDQPSTPCRPSLASETRRGRALGLTAPAHEDPRLSPVLGRAACQSCRSSKE